MNAIVEIYMKGVIRHYMLNKVICFINKNVSYKY